MTYPGLSTKDLADRETSRLNQVNTARDQAMPDVAQLLHQNLTDYPWMHADALTALSLAKAPPKVTEGVAQAAAAAAMRSGAANLIATTRMAATTSTPGHKWYDVGNWVRTGTRYATAALSTPVEMAQNIVGGSLGAAYSGDWGHFGKQMWDTTLGAEGTTLDAMLTGKNAGDGYFASGQAHEQQATMARQIRGTNEQGQAWTLGRAVKQLAYDAHLDKPKADGSDGGAAGLLSGVLDFAFAAWADPLNVSRGAHADLSAAEGMSAAQRGRGPIGNAIMDARKAKEAEAVAQGGALAQGANQAAGMAAKAEHVAGMFPGAGAENLAGIGKDYHALAASLSDKANDLAGVKAALKAPPELRTAAAKAAWEKYAKNVQQGWGNINSPKFGAQVYMPATMKRLLTREGREAVNVLTAEESPTRIWALLGGNAPVDVANKLASAKTQAEVVTALGEGMSVEGGLRNFTKVDRWGNLLVRVGEKRRLFGDMSRASDAYIQLSEPGEAVEKIYNLLGSAKVVGSERNAIVDDVIRGLASGNEGAVYHASKGLKDGRYFGQGIDTVTEALAHATDPTEITTLTKQLDDLQQGQQIAGSYSKVRGALENAVRDSFVQRTAESLSAKGDELAGSGGIKAAVGQALKRHAEDYIIHPADLDRMLTPGREVDHLSVYTAFDHANLNPQFSNGPLFTNQLANDYIHILDPAAGKRIADQVSPMATFLLGPDGSKRRLGKTLASHFQDEIWKTSVLSKVSTGVRMLAEEAVRTSLGGGFRGTQDLMMAFARRGLSIDALGASVSAAKELSKVEKEIGALERAGGALSDLEGLKNQRRLLEAALEPGKVQLAESNVGKWNPHHLDAMEQKLGGTMDTAVSSGHFDTVPHPSLDSRFATRYQRALIDRLNSVGSDPVARRIAAGGLLPGDTIGATKFAEGMASRPEDIEHWLAEGSGREFWQKYAGNRGWDVNDSEKLKNWVKAQTDEIQHQFGNSPEAMDAIATGRLQYGEETSRIAQPDKYRRTEHDDVMKAWARDYTASPGAPDHVLYEKTLRDIENSKPGTAGHILGQKLKDGRSAFFRQIYSNKSDEFFRVPLSGRRYWAHMEEMIPKLTAEDAAIAAKNALADGALNDAAKARIQTLATTAAGSGKLEHADQLAKAWTIDDVEKLFFKADRDPYLIDKARLVFPFGRAFAEVGTTWARIIKEDPTVLHSIQKTFTAAQESGVFHKDANGKQVFTYPGSGELTQWATGVNNPFSGRVSDLSIAGTIVPSFGPVVSIPAWFVSQHAPIPSSARSLLFPFGSPKPIDESLIPSWLDKLRQGWNQDETDTTYGNTFFRVTQALLASGDYDNSATSQAQLVEDAKSKAGALTALRGAMQFFGPTSPIPDQVAKTPGGDVLASKMMSDYRQMYGDKNYLKASGYDTPEHFFIAKYGEANIGYLVARTASAKTGVSYTDKFLDWRNGDGAYAAKTYKSVYGYLGPQDAMGDHFSFAAYDQLMHEGNATPKSVNDLLGEANSKLARNRYQEAIANLDAQYPHPTKTQQAKLDELRQGVKEQLVHDFPGFNPDSDGMQAVARIKEQANELEIMAQDSKLDDEPSVQILRQYLQAKATAEAAAAKKNPKTPGLGAKKNEAFKQWLTDGATSLATTDDGFRRMWRDILSKDL